MVFNPPDDPNVKEVTVPEPGRELLHVPVPRKAHLHDLRRQRGGEGQVPGQQPAGAARGEAQHSE